MAVQYYMARGATDCPARHGRTLNPDERNISQDRFAGFGDPAKRVRSRISGHIQYTPQPYKQQLCRCPPHYQNIRSPTPNVSHWCLQLRTSALPRAAILTSSPLPIGTRRRPALQLGCALQLTPTPSAGVGYTCVSLQPHGDYFGRCSRGRFVIVPGHPLQLTEHANACRL